ncbi:MAG TPA: nucleotidyltransferase domain-containing protein, partial [Thermomicrobiales bacterium]
MHGTSEQNVPTILRDLAARLASRQEVTAVAIAGSRATQVADHDSDFDLYVYAEQPVPIAVRTALADEFGIPSPREIGNDFWGSSDAWRVGTVDHDTDLDLMYFTPRWMADQLDRVLVRHQPSLGYSTCFWHTILHSIALYDRDDWFARLQAQAAAPYPEPLRRAIIAHNYPVLRGITSSLRQQLALAIERADRVSIQHRLTAILASYFDILFAV